MAVDDPTLDGWPDALAVDGVAGAGQGGGAERQAVRALADVGQALAVAVERFDVASR